MLVFDLLKWTTQQNVRTDTKLVSGIMLRPIHTIKLLLYLWLTKIVFAVSLNTRIEQLRGFHHVKSTNTSSTSITRSVIIYISYNGNLVESGRYFEVIRVTEGEATNRLRALYTASRYQSNICKKIPRHQHLLYLLILSKLHCGRSSKFSVFVFV